MRYNRYTKSSPKVSEIGLGAWQLGIESGWKGLTEEEAEESESVSGDLGKSDSSNVLIAKFSDEQFGRKEKPEQQVDLFA